MEQTINCPLSETTEINHISNYAAFDFSDIAEQMAALKATIFNSQESHAMKIEFIKEELLTGRYQIHGQRIAMGLLEYAQIKGTSEVEFSELVL